MDWKKYKSIYSIAILTLALYLSHKLLVALLAYGNTYANFHYSLEILYVFFGSCSLTILVLLLKIKEKNFDNIGMAFLLVTSTKMVLCYLMVRPILNQTNPGISIEKINFFMMFILFLAIETVVVIRILNNKQ